MDWYGPYMFLLSEYKCFLRFAFLGHVFQCILFGKFNAGGLLSSDGNRDTSEQAIQNTLPSSNIWAYIQEWAS